MATMTPGGPATDSEKVITVMAEDLNIEGTITFRSSLRIEGSVKGEIVSEGLLVIAPTAKIVATIQTKKLISEGATEGDVTASEQVVLKNNSVHTGSITAPSLVVESGSTLNGPIVMVKTAQPVHEVAVTESVVETEPSIDESREAEVVEQTGPAGEEYAEPVVETEPESEPEPWRPKQPARELF